MQFTVTSLKKRFRWPTRKQLGRLALWVVVLGAIAGFGLIIYLEQTLPDPESITSRQIAESTKIYDRTGKVLLYDIHGDQKRTIVPWEKIPQYAKDATLASEDANFYSHGGFDVRGIVRSVLKDILALDFSQGGSTLTQQLVKNALLGGQKTPLRKIQELILSVEIESKFTKDQIFWMYLNQIPYGSNAYGIEAASKAYFGKEAADLTLNESAIIASLIQAPTHYSPYGSHVDELIARKNGVLARMKELGFITDAELQKALTEKLVFKSSAQDISAPHFVIMVKDYLEKKIWPRRSRKWWFKNYHHSRCKPTIYG